MIFICQTVDLFRCQPAIAEHTNLSTAKNRLRGRSYGNMEIDKQTSQSVPVWLCAPMIMMNPTFQGFPEEQFSFL